MSAPDNGGPAFPEAGLSGLPNGEFIYGQPGMSLRDYFAGQSISGTRPGSLINDVDVERTAREAYRMADAMLKARAS